MTSQSLHSIVTYLSPKYGSSSISLEFLILLVLYADLSFVFRALLRPHRNIFAVISHKRAKSHAEMTKYMQVSLAHCSRMIGSRNETGLKLQSVTLSALKLQQRCQEHVLVLVFQLAVIRNIID